jgi:hypothetical protein
VFEIGSREFFLVGVDENLRRSPEATEDRFIPRLRRG